MKLFVVSDIHGFAKELIKSLNEAGYDKNNPNHKLIVLGDLFDRGEEAVATYKFIRSIPKDRRVLVRGNHEALFKEILDKPVPESHDVHNKTIDTVCQIANSIKPTKDPTGEPFADAGFIESYSEFEHFGVDEEMSKYWKRIAKVVKNSAINKWVSGDEWVNYYEYNKYIFVHSFIPTRISKEAQKKFGDLVYIFNDYTHFEYDPTWRDQSDYAWETASWGCPWTHYLGKHFDPLAKEGKVLVCGHWHTSDFFLNLKHVKGHDGEIYFSKNLIAIDGGLTVEYLDKEHDIYKFHHHQNVLVIDDDDPNCYNEKGEILVELPSPNQKANKKNTQKQQKTKKHN